jgi:hypothetical protein
MDPIDPWPTRGGVEWPGGSNHQDRLAIAPGVEDCHGPVHQSNVAVKGDGHRAATGFGEALGNGDGVLLVQAQNYLWRCVAEMVDEAVVKPAETCPRRQGNEGNVKPAQHLRDNVAAPADALVDRRRRTFGSAISLQGWIGACRH